MHMQKILVKKGQNIKQGDVIGTVGSTGRATGAHLDVRLNWFQTRLDPATVLNIKWELNNKSIVANFTEKQFVYKKVEFVRPFH